MKRLFLILGLILVSSLNARAGEPPRIVTSIPPVHGLVSMVTAGVFEPELLLPGTVSPHTYHLKPSDAAMLESAEIVFWISPMMETVLAKPMEVIAGKAVDVHLMDARGLKILPLREGGVFHDHGHDDEHEEDTVDADAHVWLSPANAIVMLFVISETLGEIDPANAVQYRANAVAGIGALQKLDAEIEAALGPVRGVPYVAFHDAYQYFEERYELKPLATMAVDPEHAPGPKRLAEVREAIKDSGARCAFSEPQFSPKIMATLVEGTGAKAATLDPLGVDIEPGPSFYPALLQKMTDSLLNCLSGD